MRQVFANYLAAPFAGGAILFLYLTWTQDLDYAPWIIPFVLMTALIYVLGPQINWWWYNRYPQDLSPGLTDLLERFCRFYQRLDATEKKRFRERVALFQAGTDWDPMGWPDDVLPPDVEVALAAQAVMLTFSRPKFLFEKFEKVVVYPKPFPTPEYPFFHGSELFEPDGCLLFSAEQVMAGFLQVNIHYNVGLHEYAKAFILTYPNEPYPAALAPDVWEKLQQASGLSREQVESAIGIAGVEPLPVAIHHYFVFPEPFRKIFPEQAAAFDQIFGIEYPANQQSSNQKPPNP
jgi:hypothetical protein